jgi:hypothetical protein
LWRQNQTQILDSWTNKHCHFVVTSKKASKQPTLSNYYPTPNTMMSSWAKNAIAVLYPEDEETGDGSLGDDTDNTRGGGTTDGSGTGDDHPPLDPVGTNHRRRSRKEESYSDEDDEDEDDDDDDDDDEGSEPPECRKTTKTLTHGQRQKTKSQKNPMSPFDQTHETCDSSYQQGYSGSESEEDNEDDDDISDLSLSIHHSSEHDPSSPPTTTTTTKDRRRNQAQRNPAGTTTTTTTKSDSKPSRQRRKSSRKKPLDVMSIGCFKDEDNKEDKIRCSSAVVDSPNDGGMGGKSSSCSSSGNVGVVGRSDRVPLKMMIPKEQQELATLKKHLLKLGFRATHVLLAENDPAESAAVTTTMAMTTTSCSSPMEPSIEARLLARPSSRTSRTRPSSTPDVKSREDDDDDDDKPENETMLPRIFQSTSSEGIDSQNEASIRLLATPHNKLSAWALSKQQQQQSSSLSSDQTLPVNNFSTTTMPSWTILETHVLEENDATELRLATPTEERHIAVYPRPVGTYQTYRMDTLEYHSSYTNTNHQYQHQAPQPHQGDDEDSTHGATGRPLELVTAAAAAAAALAEGDDDDEEPLSKPRALFPDALSSSEEDPWHSSIPLEKKDTSRTSHDTAASATSKNTVTRSENHESVAVVNKLLPTTDDNDDDNDDDDDDDETVWICEDEALLDTEDFSNVMNRVPSFAKSAADGAYLSSLDQESAELDLFFQVHPDDQASQDDGLVTENSQVVAKRRYMDVMRRWSKKNKDPVVAVREAGSAMEDVKFETTMAPQMLERLTAPPKPKEPDFFFQVHTDDQASHDGLDGTENYQQHVVAKRRYMDVMRRWGKKNKDPVVVVVPAAAAAASGTVVKFETIMAPQMAERLAAAPPNRADDCTQLFLDRVHSCTSSAPSVDGLVKVDDEVQMVDFASTQRDKDIPVVDDIDDTEGRTLYPQSEMDHVLFYQPAEVPVYHNISSMEHVEASEDASTYSTHLCHRDTESVDHTGTTQVEAAVDDIESQQAPQNIKTTMDMSHVPSAPVLCDEPLKSDHKFAESVKSVRDDCDIEDAGTPLAPPDSPDQDGVQMAPPQQASESMKAMKENQPAPRSRRMGWFHLVLLFVLIILLITVGVRQARSKKAKAAVEAALEASMATGSGEGAVPSQPPITTSTPDTNPTVPPVEKPELDTPPPTDSATETVPQVEKPQVETPPPTDSATDSVPTKSNACSDWIHTDATCYANKMALFVSFNNCDPLEDDWIGVYPSDADPENLGSASVWVWSCGTIDCEGARSNDVFPIEQDLPPGTFKAFLVRRQTGGPYSSYASSDEFTIEEEGVDCAQRTL